MSRLKKPDPVAKAIGRRVRALRLQRGLTLEKLAYENDMSKGTISDLEVGLARPSVITLKKIANGLGVELLDLFTDPSASDRHRLIDRTRRLTASALRDLVVAADQAPVKKRGSPGF